jgi:iron-sulfur cluster assembly 2
MTVIGMRCASSQSRFITTTDFVPSMATGRTNFLISSSFSGYHWITKNQFCQRRWMVMVTHTKAAMDHDTNATTRGKIASMEAAEDKSSNLPLQEPQSILVTEACYKRIHHLISMKQQNDLYLRVFVDAGGCSGFTYQFELDTDANLNTNDDIVFTETLSPKDKEVLTLPARVVVDRGSLKLIAGSKIDFVQEMIKSSFEVQENPQSESACGCGSSFALKNFASNPAVD